MLYFRKVCLLVALALTFGTSALFAQVPDAPSGISVKIVSPADSSWVGLNGKITVEVSSAHLLSGLTADSATDTAFAMFNITRLALLQDADEIGQFDGMGDDTYLCHTQADNTPEVSTNKKKVTWEAAGCKITSTITKHGNANPHVVRYVIELLPINNSGRKGGITGVFAAVRATVGTEGQREVSNVNPGADGKFLRIDTGRPVQSANVFTEVGISKDADGTVDVSEDANDSGGDDKRDFKIGETINLTAKLSSLQGAQDATAIKLGLFAFSDAYQDVYMADPDSAFALQTFKINSALGNVMGAGQGGTLMRHSVKVNAGDFEVLDADDELIEDNIRVKVAVFLVDRAGNIGAAADYVDPATPALGAPFSGDATVIYRVDSRKPKVEIKHPVAVDNPDSNRFTGAIDTTFAGFRNNNGTRSLDVDLRPLELNVDEGLDSLRVTIKTPKDSLVHADITGDYDETPDNQKIDTEDKFKTAGGNDLPSSKKGGQPVDLMVMAQDSVGNRTTVTVKGVIFDEAAPAPSNLFPENVDLGANPGTINEATRHPIVRFEEVLDSLSVRFVQNIATNPHRISHEVEEVGDFNVGKDNTVTVNDTLRNNLTYYFQLFARDLAGNVHVTDEDTLKFQKSFKNPPANMFVVEAKPDSQIAGKEIELTITAVDSVQRNKNKDRGTAVTYRNSVRLSAWDGDEMASSVVFTGDAVAKNEDGTFTVDGSAWNAGVLAEGVVKAKSNMVLDDFTIKVEDVSSTVVDDEARTTVNFMGEKTGLYVDADRMTKFVVTAWEDGKEAKTVSGEFGVNVMPTDKFGNPSIKKVTGNSALDTRITNANQLKNFSIVLSADHPDASVPQGPQPMAIEGKTFTVKAPNRNGSDLTITASVAGVEAGASAAYLIARGSVTVDYTGVAPAPSDSLAGPAYLTVMDVENDQGHRVLVTFPLSADHAEVDEYRLYRQYDIGDGRGMQFIRWGEAYEPSGADSVVTYPVGVPDAMATHWAIEAIGAKPSSPTVSGKLSAAVIASPRTLTAEPVAALDNMPPDAATDVMLDANTISWTLSPSEGPTTETYTNSWTGQAGIAIPGVTGYEIMVGLSEDAMNSVGKVGAGVSSFALSAEVIAPLIVAGVITQEQLARLIATDLLGVMVRVDALDVSNSVPSMIYTVVEMGRREFTSAEGTPVFIVNLEGDMTVGFDDFMAFAAAYGTSEDADAWNVQADLNDDGRVDFADFILFVGSYGMTAQGPSSKPVILPPGVNENAEFSLRLGSERVVVGQNVFVDVSLANVQALMGYGFVLNYDADKFEFVEAAPTDQDLLKSTGGETPLFSSIANESGRVSIANAVVNGSEISGGGDIVRLTFRVLQEFSENARFEIAEGLVFDPQQLSNPAVVAGVLDVQTTPTEFALLQNFPNPFNPETTIGYELAESADVTLQIYNVVGQVVRTLIAAESQAAGRYQIRWDGMDDRGVSVSSGIYFYRISAGEFQTVRKLMLLK